MKRQFSFVLSILLFFTAVSQIIADTDVSGNVQGQWTTEGSPYNVIANVTIQNNQSLTIDPGVRVYFEAGTKMIINGRLEAIGTEMDSIRFTPRPGNASFGGLRFLDPDENTRLSFCVISEGAALRGEQPLDSIGGCALIMNGSIILENSRISGGRANNLGAGIAILGGSHIIRNCNIVENDAAIRGGGVAVIENASLDFQNNLVQGNLATLGGGGMFIGSRGNISLLNSQFISNNTARSEENPGVGGAIDVRNNAQPTITKCYFFENIGTAGGAIYIRDAETAPTITYCDFIANSARLVDQVGGAVYIRGSAPAVLRYNRFLSNGANFGGAIYIKEPPTCTIDHNLFVQNGSLRGGGAIGTAVDLGNRPLQITNSTFTRNNYTGIDAVPITVLIRGGTPLQMSSCIIWDDQPLFNEGNITISHSQVRGGFDGEGNSEEDPSWYDDGADYYLLQANSPCRDTGNPNLPEDPDDTQNDRGWAHYPVNVLEGLVSDTLAFETEENSLTEVEFHIRNDTGVPIYLSPSEYARPNDNFRMQNLSTIFDLNDFELKGITLIDTVIYLSGSNNGRAPNKIYKLDGAFNFISSFSQPGDIGRDGFSDLTSDNSQIIYGGNEQNIVEFAADGELGERYPKPNDIETVVSLTADFNTPESGNAEFYLGGSEGFIVRTNSAMWEHSRIQIGDPILALAMKGNSRALYVVTQAEEMPPLLSLVLPDDERVIPLFYLELPENYRMGGMDITHDWIEGKGVLVGIWQGEGDDADMLFMQELYTTWLIIIPETKLVLPGEQVSWTLTASGLQMPVGHYDGEFYLMLNGSFEDFSVPATITNDVVFVQDNRLSPIDYQIVSVYPNPFNALARYSFIIRHSGNTSVDLLDLQGRLINNIFKGHLEAGSHIGMLNAQDIPTGKFFLRVTHSGKNNSTEDMQIVPIIILR